VYQTRSTRHLSRLPSEGGSSTLHFDTDATEAVLVRFRDDQAGSRGVVKSMNCSAEPRRAAPIVERRRGVNYFVHHWGYPEIAVLAVLVIGVHERGFGPSTPAPHWRTPEPDGAGCGSPTPALRS